MPVRLNLECVLGVLFAVLMVSTNVASGANNDHRVAHVIEAVQAPPPSPRFFGQWEEGENADDVVEGGEWETLDEALIWARLRAPVVILRTSNETGLDSFWSAGEQVADAYGTDPVSIWPDTPEVSLGERHSQYGGTVFVSENAPSEYILTGDYVVRLSSEESLEETQTNADGSVFTDLDEALDFARKSAPVVIVRLGAPPYEFLSAGSQPPSSRDLPKWFDAPPIEPGWIDFRKP